MNRESEKKNYTTGDIAKMCGVNFRTVIRWIQRGHLKAFQLPGRGDHRVLRKDFLAFLNQNNMPLPEELTSSVFVVVAVDNDSEGCAAIEKALTKLGFEVAVAADAFSAGAAVMSRRPAVFALDVTQPGFGGLNAVFALKQDSDLSAVRVLVVSDLSNDQVEEALAVGADEVIPRCDPRELAQRIQSLARGQ